MVADRASARVRIRERMDFLGKYEVRGMKYEFEKMDGERQGKANLLLELRMTV